MKESAPSSYGGHKNRCLSANPGTVLSQRASFSVPRAATVLNADIESNSTNHSLRVVKNQCTHFFYRSPRPKTCRRHRQQPPGLALALSIPAARACICLYAGQMLRMLLVVIPKPVSMDPLSKDCSELMASRLRFNPSTQASTGKHLVPKPKRFHKSCSYNSKVPWPLYILLLQMSLGKKGNLWYLPYP